MGRLSGLRQLLRRSRRCRRSCNRPAAAPRASKLPLARFAETRLLPPQGTKAQGAQAFVGYKGSTIAGSAPTCVPAAAEGPVAFAWLERYLAHSRAAAPAPARLASCTSWA